MKEPKIDVNFIIGIAVSAAVLMVVSLIVPLVVSYVQHPQQRNLPSLQFDNFLPAFISCIFGVISIASLLSLFNESLENDEWVIKTVIASLAGLLCVGLRAGDSWGFYLSIALIVIAMIVYRIFMNIRGDKE